MLVPYRSTLRFIGSLSSPSLLPKITSVVEVHRNTSSRVHQGLVTSSALSKPVEEESGDEPASTSSVSADGTTLADDTSSNTKLRKPKMATYAMLLAYDGSQHYGMAYQTNHLATIEGELHSAFCKMGIAEGVSIPKDFGQIKFHRAAKTDAGVCAVGQMISIKIPFANDFRDRAMTQLAELLPESIRVLGIRKATPSFNAYEFCDARTYSYLLPTYAFADSTELTTTNYRISADRIREANEILNAFVGTHNFYNYTARRTHSDKSCNRPHTLLSDREPFVYHEEVNKADVEFIRIGVTANSFMLHQIRKLIGMTISVMRNLVQKSDIQKAFEEERLQIPRAPSTGLFLERLHYEWYDRNYGHTHLRFSDWGEDIERKMVETRRDLVISSILKNECSTFSMMNWLSGQFFHKIARRYLDDKDKMDVLRVCYPKRD